MSDLDRLAPGLVYHVVNTLGWSTLRPLQAAAIAPLLDGQDALLLAPTAGGKTEAATFPLLTAMTQQGWHGLSVLYVCPLKALLNNLHGRLRTYGHWLGRDVGIWHGDTTEAQRRRLRIQPPDILLTTPESLESLLVSRLVTPREFFADLQAVVVDEVHAFAGDDRGWHLLGVLERLTRLAGRPIQRVGLSATVGNPEQLINWLQGSAAGWRPAAVVAPEVTTATPVDAEVGLDYVGNVQNAAAVIAALHRGEKRLVFAESRRRVEELALELRSKRIATFVSHSSLSADERKQAEQAFAEARDCVIVSTSTLELGIDVGDLDRVIQIDAPTTVASFLQRLGRTGRRADSRRNMLFLATRQEALLHAAGLLHLWRIGFVEPVTAPPEPRHIAAQQILALCLQEGRIGDTTWADWWGDLPLFDETAHDIVDHLVDSEHIERDEAGMLFIGAAAERRYGHRNFMDLLAVFTAPPQFVVLHGRTEIGGADPIMLMLKTEGPKRLSLGGRSWQVNHIDWKRQRCYVEPSDHHARSLWSGTELPHSYALSQAQRAVLLGTDPAVEISQRAEATLTKLRDETGLRAAADGTVIVDNGEDRTWWTWAGGRGNATLAAALPSAIDRETRVENHSVRLRSDVDRAALRRAVDAIEGDPIPTPDVSDDALRQLKFNEMLPEPLAAATLGKRLADPEAARMIIAQRRLWRLI
ncbi:DEAD/DEAH box helicase [Catellatospora sp. NPDC049111]|uniref:DEAD/DEAH box helicase n=1 Tax=Catellatospora sp. NPDC049111 TaxID=3155271 RepID=UPI003410A54B